MKLFKRLVFSVRMLHRYRHALAEIYYQSPRHYSLYQLSPTQLKQQGVKVLVLDFDGVLAAHGELQPVEELRHWLLECANVFGGEQIFVLSNKPLPSRIDYFNHHYPGIRYITEVKKKPYPDGLEKIIALTGFSPGALRLVDDRLLTGALAGCIAQVPIIYISKPYIDWSKRPVQELFFTTLRSFERHFIFWYGKL